MHGLFPRRQNEAAEVYARIIADDVITLESIGTFLLEGPRGDRTRQMLVTALRRPSSARPGPRGPPSASRSAPRYDTIRDSVAREAVERTITPLIDPGSAAAKREDPRAGGRPHEGAAAPRTSSR